MEGVGSPHVRARGIGVGSVERVTGIDGGRDELELEIEALVRAIRGEGLVVADGNDGVWSIALCEAAHRSIETGEVVSMKGFKL